MPETHGSPVIPSMRYRDAHAAIDWLCNVLGFARHAVYEGPDNTIAHAELTFHPEGAACAGMIMLGSASNPQPYPQALAHPDEIGKRDTGAVYLIVPDCTPIYARAEAAGAEVLLPLKTMDYGGQAFTLRDPEGYIWSVGEYSPWRQQG